MLKNHSFQVISTNKSLQPLFISALHVSAIGSTAICKGSKFRVVNKYDSYDPTAPIISNAEEYGRRNINFRTGSQFNNLCTRSNRRKF